MFNRFQDVFAALDNNAAPNHDAAVALLDRDDANHAAVIAAHIGGRVQIFFNAIETAFANANNANARNKINLILEALRVPVQRENMFSVEPDVYGVTYATLTTPVSQSLFSQLGRLVAAERQEIAVAAAQAGGAPAPQNVAELQRLLEDEQAASAENLRLLEEFQIEADRTEAGLREELRVARQAQPAIQAPVAELQAAQDRIRILEGEVLAANRETENRSQLMRHAASEAINARTRATQAEEELARAQARIAALEAAGPAPAVDAAALEAAQRDAQQAAQRLAITNGLLEQARNNVEGLTRRLEDANRDLAAQREAVNEIRHADFEDVIDAGHIAHNDNVARVVAELRNEVRLAQEALAAARAVPVGGIDPVALHDAQQRVIVLEGQLDGVQIQLGQAQQTALRAVEARRVADQQARDAGDALVLAEEARDNMEEARDQALLRVRGLEAELVIVRRDLVQAQQDLNVVTAARDALRGERDAALQAQQVAENARDDATRLAERNDRLRQDAIAQFVRAETDLQALQAEHANQLARRDDYRQQRNVERNNVVAVTAERDTAQQAVRDAIRERDAARLQRDQAIAAAGGGAVIRPATLRELTQVGHAGYIQEIAAEVLALQQARDQEAQDRRNAEQARDQFELQAEQARAQTLANQALYHNGRATIVADLQTANNEIGILRGQLNQVTAQLAQVTGERDLLRAGVQNGVQHQVNGAHPVGGPAPVVNQPILARFRMARADVLGAPVVAQPVVNAAVQPAETTVPVTQVRTAKISI